MLHCPAVNKLGPRRGKWLGFALFWAILVAINGLAAPKAEAQDPATEIFQLVNNFRASLGLPPFKWNGQLATASQVQADWLLANPNSFVHTWPNGTTKEMRAVQAGYSGRVVENIVGGWNMTPQRALTWWQNSPPHYNTITSSFYNEAGTAFAGSGTDRRYVIVVGNRGASSAAPRRDPEPEPIYVEPIVLAEPDDTGQITHVAGKGHALWTIAAYYDVEVSDLLLYNDMGENDLVSVGDEIIVQPPTGWVPPPTPTPPFTVIVQKGQTLWTIAAIHQVELVDVLRYNGIEADDVISAGDEIKIRLRPGEAPPTFTPTPTPVQLYNVREGDSAWSISARFGITLDQLLGWNNLSTDPILSVGQELWVVSPSDGNQPPEEATPVNEGNEQEAESATPTPHEQVVVQLPTVTSNAPTPVPTETPAAEVAQVNQSSDDQVPSADNLPESVNQDSGLNWPLIISVLGGLYLLAGLWMLYQSRELS